MIPHKSFLGYVSAWPNHIFGISEVWKVDTQIILKQIVIGIPFHTFTTPVFTFRYIYHIIFGTRGHMVFVDDVKTSFFTQNTNVNLIIGCFCIDRLRNQVRSYFWKIACINFDLNEIFNICAVGWKFWLESMVNAFHKEREIIET